jgi:hypothetical protein
MVPTVTTRLLTPSNVNAVPNRPEVLHVAEVIAPVRPFPDASDALVPAPSSRP